MEFVAFAHAGQLYLGPSSDGTPGQVLARAAVAGTTEWVNQSGGGGSPGGADTQVQFNDAGAFGGDSGLTWNKTTNVLTVTGGFVGPAAYSALTGVPSSFAPIVPGSGTELQYRINASTLGAVPSSSVTGNNIFVLGNISNSGIVRFRGGSFAVGTAFHTVVWNNAVVGWGSTSSVDETTVPDTGLSRNAAGVVEINNGTKGTLSDLVARNISAVDLTLSGNLVVNGTSTTINTATITVDDPLIRLADNNAADSVDIGSYGLYVEAATNKYTGLFRDASDGKWRLFTGLQVEPTTTVNIGGAGYTVATLVASLEGNVTGTASNAIQLSGVIPTGFFLTLLPAQSDADVLVILGINYLTDAGAGGLYLDDTGTYAAVDWTEITSKPATFAPSAHATSHQAGGGDTIKLDDLAAPDDNTDLNVSTTAHGLQKKLPNDATLFLNGVGNYTAPPNHTAIEIVLEVGDGTNAITTGIKGYARIKQNMTITGWSIISYDSAGAAVVGSIVFDVWKDTYANFPPTVADTITASAKPTLSSASKATSTTLTGWTTAITADDYIGINVDSITTCKKVRLILFGVKT